MLCGSLDGSGAWGRMDMYSWVPSLFPWNYQSAYTFNSFVLQVNFEGKTIFSPFNKEWHQSSDLIQIIADLPRQDCTLCLGRLVFWSFPKATLPVDVIIRPADKCLTIEIPTTWLEAKVGAGCSLEGRDLSPIFPTQSWRTRPHNQLPSLWLLPFFFFFFTNTQWMNGLSTIQIFYFSEAPPPKWGSYGLHVFPADLKYNPKGVIFILLLLLLLLLLFVFTYLFWLWVNDTSYNRWGPTASILTFISTLTINVVALIPYFPMLMEMKTQPFSHWTALCCVAPATANMAVVIAFSHGKTH